MVWSSGGQLREVFLDSTSVWTFNPHSSNSDSELEEESTIRNFRIVQTEGSRQVTRDTKHYSLQMIIAVGFKVNSERAVQFRKSDRQGLHHQRLGDG